MSPENKLFEADENSTPLSPEDAGSLLPSYIKTRAELNDAEFLNISMARAWAFTRRRNVLDEAFLKRLHKNMFGDVWKWAGKYRTVGLNLGVEVYQIQPEILKLLADASYWIEHEVYPPDELVAHFHHKLVWIHPFKNGNGRHARLAADLLGKNLGLADFSWGGRCLIEAGQARAAYIKALKAADNHDIASLVAFLRS